METNIAYLVGTAVIAIVTWLASKKFLLPYIIKFFNWVRGRKKEQDDLNIDATKELAQIRKDVGEIYETRIQFLLKQISILQDQVQKNCEAVARLQDKIKEMNDNLYSKNITIHQLQENSCCVENCKYRVLCNLSELSDKK